MPQNSAVTPRRDWSPDPIVDWLMTAGRALKCPQQLTAQLSRMLVESGAPLLRVRMSMRTIHPQITGSSYTWWRDRPDVEEYSPPHSILQSSDYQGSPIEAVQTSGNMFRCRLADADMSQLHSSLQDLHQQGTTDYVVYPLIQTYESRPATWILGTDVIGGFTTNDLDGFARIATFLASVVEVISLQRSARSLLNTYLGPRTGQRVFDGQIKRGDGERIEAVIWYSDLRDFTFISESLPPHDLLKLLNQYFEAISDAVSARGGEVLRFIGDAMLVMFPVEHDRTLQQGCRDAVAAARAAQLAVDKINPQLQASGLPSIRYGLGLDVGEVIYGNVGAPNRLDFTIMGPVVNRAARIEELTKKTGCPVLASEPFALQQPDTFIPRGEFEVQGVQEPLQVYGLQSLSGNSR
ncbi:MAG: adenylate/guanylate cyclase domain-containing protein [Motiliproteus sp.]